MYQVDGVSVSYTEMLKKVMDALEEEGWDVSYAFHLGTDCYWIYEQPPWFAKAVYLTPEGLKAGYKIIEPLKT